MNKPLITPEEFTTYKNISKKYDKDKVSQAIKLGQTDLQQELGGFYFDVIRNSDSEDYTDLLNGSFFSKDGIEQYHEGLKSLLADYSFSRYLYELNITHSPHGLTVKLSQDSEPVDRNIIRDLVKQTNIDAGRKLALIKDYLNANTDKFTVWRSSNQTNNSGFNSQKFTFLSTNRR